MANFRIKLSDGTTTIDMYSGTDVYVMEGGLIIPAPVVDSVYIGSPPYHGDRLARSRYRNRQIDINVKIVGTSLSDLQTNIRSVFRLLDDAKERTLKGRGSQVYLEYQWGDIAGQSVYYDILEGYLTLPVNHQSVLLSERYHIIDAVISLTCKPFGRFTNQDESQATLENEDYSTNHNYQDIAAAAANGDVAAKLFWKLAMSGATGTKKTWLAKRSGDGYDDDLWVQGEDEDSATEIVSGDIDFSDESDAALSGSAFKRAAIFIGAAGSLDADTEITRLNYVFATPPKGQFRVLIYCRTQEVNDAAEYAKMAWGMGYSYGDLSKAPSEASDEYYSNNANNAWEILDLGEILIPPTAESEIATNNSFELRICQYNKEALSGTDVTVDPTSHNDPGGVWATEANAYDNDTGTSSPCNVPAGSWSDYLELIRAATTSYGVKFRVSHEDENITNIDVDAYYDAAWHDLYEGTFEEETWINKRFSDGPHSVTKYRFRFYNNAGGIKWAAVIEVDFITQPSSHQWDIDYIFLLPIDEGVVIIDDVDASDVIAIDSISDPPGVFILDGSDNIEDVPDTVGRPFTLGREDTRLYVLRNDVKGVTFTSDVKYQPRFLVI